MFHLLLNIFRMVLLNKESGINNSMGQSLVGSFSYQCVVRDKWFKNLANSLYNELSLLECREDMEVCATRH